MSRLSAYLVDDEQPALNRLGRLLEETGRMDVLGSSTNPRMAIEYLQAHKPDAIFLDIQMPEINGFELLAHLDFQPLVIFTTAYDQYALEAFAVNSIDYLLKPVDPAHLERALDKLERLKAEPPAWLKHPEFLALVRELPGALRDRRPLFAERIPVRIGARTQFVELHRITHFIAQDRLTYAVTESKTYCVDWPITELEQRLDPTKFVKIHRAVLLHLSWVEELTSSFAGRLTVRLKDQKRTELTVARDRARALKSQLGL